VPSVLLDTDVAREVCGDAALYVARDDIASTAAALDSLLFDERVRSRVLESTPAVLARYSWTRAATATLAALEAASGHASQGSGLSRAPSTREPGRGAA
jgi:glycosyltransferase involved in cell wall biosynthesis